MYAQPGRNWCDATRTPPRSSGAAGSPRTSCPWRSAAADQGCECGSRGGLCVGRPDDVAPDACGAAAFRAIDVSGRRSAAVHPWSVEVVRSNCGIRPGGDAADPARRPNRIRDGCGTRSSPRCPAGRPPTPPGIFAAGGIDCARVSFARWRRTPWLGSDPASGIAACGPRGRDQGVGELPWAGDVRDTAGAGAAIVASLRRVFSAAEGAGECVCRWSSEGREGRPRRAGTTGRWNSCGRSAVGRRASGNECSCSTAVRAPTRCRMPGTNVATSCLPGRLDRGGRPRIS